MCIVNILPKLSLNRLLLLPSLSDTNLLFFPRTDHSFQISFVSNGFQLFLFPLLSLLRANCLHASCVPSSLLRPSKSRHNSEGVACSHGNRAKEPGRSHWRSHLSVCSSSWVLQEAGWGHTQIHMWAGGSCIMPYFLRPGNYRSSSSDQPQWEITSDASESSLSETGSLPWSDSLLSSYTPPPLTCLPNLKHRVLEV